ncbi:MAG: hypothetical protein RLZZ293_1339, partial [Pseudomonadota bacterium]
KAFADTFFFGVSIIRFLLLHEYPVVIEKPYSETAYKLG